MKIRNGFVSNSSSSSFVVKYRHNDWSEIKENRHKFLLNKKQLNALKKNGFAYTQANNPYFVDNDRFPFFKSMKSFNKFEEIYLGRYVSCNQNDVIYFLLKNKIPFVALCHYDQNLVVWDGEASYFYTAPNVIEECCRANGIIKYDVGEWNQYYPAQLVGKINRYEIDEWLKNEEKYIGNLV